MSTVADVVDVVIGVDTHTDTHTLVVTNAAGAPIGAPVTVPNTAAGHRAACELLGAQPCPPGRVAVGIEGSRSHGVALCRALAAAGAWLIEVERPRRRDRRKGKSDPIDALAAARTALAYPADAAPQPRADGTREALRILLAARRDLSTDKVAKTHRLRHHLLAGTDTDRALLRGTLTSESLRALARRRGRADEDTADTTRREEVRRLAHALLALDRDLKANQTRLADLVKTFAPGLLERRGVGPVSAARVIIAWSHPGRCRHEAAFAALAGTAPLDASSGRHHRHRLNRGGDRQLNLALHDIAFNRMVHDPRTRAYTTRRRAEGKTTAEIRRCLKRYITRELYNHLRDHATP
jgi:transposase